MTTEGRLIAFNHTQASAVLSERVSGRAALTYERGNDRPDRPLRRLSAFWAASRTG
jgi:hypothetical protein